MMKKLIISLTLAGLLLSMTPALGGGRGRWVSSTAYCLTGHTASGPTTRRAYRWARNHGADGIVAMPRARFGSRYRLIGGEVPRRFRDDVLVVVDRPAEFDIWMASCWKARNWYGRRYIKIRRVYGENRYPWR